MTLRLRLVIALAALVTVGLAVFGIATYGVYARTQYQRLDDQLRASVPLVRQQLTEAAGLQAPDGRGGPGHGPRTRDFGEPRGRPPVVVPPGTYAELRDSAGELVPSGRIQLSSSSAPPRLASRLSTTRSRLFDTGSATGSGRWRVLVVPTEVAGVDRTSVV